MNEDNRFCVLSHIESYVPNHNTIIVIGAYIIIALLFFGAGYYFGSRSSEDGHSPEKHIGSAIRTNEAAREEIKSAAGAVNASAKDSAAISTGIRGVQQENAGVAETLRESAGQVADSIRIVDECREINRQNERELKSILCRDSAAAEGTKSEVSAE